MKQPGPRERENEKQDDEDGYKDGCPSSFASATVVNSSGDRDGSCLRLKLPLEKLVET